MTPLSEVAQQALEALGLWSTGREMDAVRLNDLIFKLEAALAQEQADPVKKREEFDHGVGADRFKVVRGAYWWRVLIGDSPTKHGKFHTQTGAEEMAALLLREFRNGAFVQHEAAQEQAEPVQEQDIEDAIEAAYWHFDARRSGLNEWASAPQSERDAFKAEARKLVRGYFPTRQAQDTKREMLAVADAFMRGKRAALAQEPQTTHSDECWRWHHACAVAEVERLRAALAQEALQDLAAADREIEAALEQPVRVADELPAAWQCAECGGTETLCPHGRRDVPLYAKPQPLTDAEIDALVAPWWNSAAIAEVLASNHPAARAAGASVLRHVARAIERAHGIGGEP